MGARSSSVRARTTLSLPAFSQSHALHATLIAARTSASVADVNVVTESVATLLQVADSVAIREMRSARLEAKPQRQLCHSRIARERRDDAHVRCGNVAFR